MGRGDRLAAGGISAVFTATDGKLKEDKWKLAFDDFKPEEFYNRPAGGATSRDVSVSPRTVKRSRKQT